MHRCKLKLNSVAWVRERTKATERPPPVGEDNAVADRGCHVVNVTDPLQPYSRFLDRGPYFFFQVAPHLFSRGLVGPVPDPLLLRKSVSAGNETRTPESVASNSDH
jgi:hypothetical protein